MVKRRQQQHKNSMTTVALTNNLDLNMTQLNGHKKYGDEVLQRNVYPLTLTLSVLSLCITVLSQFPS
ncbi:hypothetical protein XELAEV_18020564mg [Xenopus laevis]|uniref:Uncharacterized protein n=1 Tax=Xenopus laevis TaxID=8355 RepID=A0A974D8X7_XENLA|nr:hypothetical protein XELAEV_18020564mg [Xenopus laevis]